MTVCRSGVQPPCLISLQCGPLPSLSANRGPMNMSSSQKYNLPVINESQRSVVWEFVCFISRYCINFSRYQRLSYEAGPILFLLRPQLISLDAVGLYKVWVGLWRIRESETTARMVYGTIQTIRQERARSTNS